MGFLDDAASVAGDALKSLAKDIGLGGGEVADQGSGKPSFMRAEANKKDIFEQTAADLKSVGGYEADSYFFNWPELTNENPFQAFPYAFVVHDGKKTIMQMHLPIRPSNISIQVPAATSTTVTLNGITEECNGAPLRHILIAGTTGVRPVSSFGALKGADTSTAGVVADQLRYAFSNTIQAVRTTVEQTQDLLNTFGDRSSETAIVVNENRPDELTSHKIAHTMMRFFDWYLDAKKRNKSNKQLFLSFHMYKDEMYYDCTLNGYSIRKPPATVEYNYTINLTAFRRREKPLEFGDATAPDQTSENNINYLGRATKALRDARGIIASALNVLKAVNSDVETIVYRPLQEAYLLGADILNAPLKLSDLASHLFTMSDAKASLRGAKNKFTEAAQDLRNAGIKLWMKANGEGTINNRTSYSKIAKMTFSEDEILEDPDKPVVGNYIGGIDPFADPIGNSEFFDEFALDDLEKSPALTEAIDDYIASVQQITPDEFQEKLVKMDEFIDDYSNLIGGQSESYNRINGIRSTEPIRELEAEDFEILKALNDSSMALSSFIVALRQTSGDVDTDYNTFYSDYARGAGLEFKDGSSKFYVPFPYGATMESLSHQYLGNPDRWMEIAAINALKSPYIDEDGFVVPFQGTGSGNEFFVTNSEGLYVGQVIVLFSDTQKEEKRRITGIDILSEVKTLVSVDGDSDLNRFTRKDNASFKAFLPNTVNSNMMIAIPSETPVNVAGAIKINPDNEDLSTLAYSSKADFMLSFNRFGSADLVMGSGDIRIARGVTNLVQAANIKVLTKTGDLLHDPSFGNPVQVGVNIADITAKDILSSLSSAFKNDDRFTGIIAGKVRLIGPSAPIDILVGLNGTNVYLPMTVQLPR